MTTELIDVEALIERLDAWVKGQGEARTIDVMAAVTALRRFSEQNRKYREALDFYAEVDHYEADPYRITVVQEDHGTKARAALQEQPNGND